jgi:hypothetical protein
MPVLSNPHNRQVAGINIKEKTMAHGHNDFKESYTLNNIQQLN